MVLVQGVCSSCGKAIRRTSPVPMTVTCDCYKECPLCGSLMEPYEQDLAPRTYGDEDNPLWDPLGEAEKNEDSNETVYACLNHSPIYYSIRLPVEVRLE